MPFFPGNFSCIQWYLMSASRPLAASSLRLLACRLRGWCLVLYSWAASSSLNTNISRGFKEAVRLPLRTWPPPCATATQRTSWAKRKNPPKIGLKNCEIDVLVSMTGTVIFWPLKEKLLKTLQMKPLFHWSLKVHWFIYSHQTSLF